MLAMGLQHNVHRPGRPSLVCIFLFICKVAELRSVCDLSNKLHASEPCSPSFMENLVQGQHGWSRNPCLLLSVSIPCPSLHKILLQLVLYKASVAVTIAGGEECLDRRVGVRNSAMGGDGPTPLHHLRAAMVPFTFTMIIPAVIVWRSSDAAIVENSRSGHAVLTVVGLSLWMLGVGVMFASNVSFHRQGKGTLEPWARPKHLVVTGLYRHATLRTVSECRWLADAAYSSSSGWM